MKFPLVLSVAVAALPLLSAQADTLEKDRAAIRASAGCFLVDYNYHEVESLLPDYKLDAREYHTSLNKDFVKFAQMYSMLDPAITPDKYQLNMKEKIWLRVDDENTIHLQHILFLTNKEGQLDFVMKHHSERWRYEADRTFEYVGNTLWKPTSVENTNGKWTREMTALDDSPRYSCTAAWDHTREFPTWTCANYSPIPGRESRDMDRSDYHGLDRIHSLTIYPNAWLDTQDNKKVREVNGERVPFVKEKGRNWYTRIPDADCNVVDSFIEERKGFWEITQGVWDELLQGEQGIYESKTGAPRWMPINGGPFIVHPGRKMVQYTKGIEEDFVKKAGQVSRGDRTNFSQAVRNVIDRYNKAP